MVYKINVPLVGGGTRKKEIIDANNNLTVDEIRAGTLSQKYVFQGSTSGYTSGGAPIVPINNNGSNIIDKFPFASDANAADVGDLSIITNTAAGSHSTENGYVSGGLGPPLFPTTRTTNSIQKFPFSSDTNATDIADLTGMKMLVTGQSSGANGYVSGGSDNSTHAPPASQYNTIEKFPFSVDANATDVGDLTLARRGSAGSSSETHGYTAGGSLFPAPPGTSPVTIDRFPFSSDANATDVGDLAIGAGFASGQSSTTHGYASGQGPPFFSDVIQKYSFSSSSNGTDIANLSFGRSIQAGQSSTTHGYVSGGQNPPQPSPDARNNIDKFSFSVDANATDVGDLTQARIGGAGTQI